MTEKSNDEIAAVAGATHTLRTRVDGSLSITIEVEPRHAQAAFAMFGAPGTPVALARITPEAATAQARTGAVYSGAPALDAQPPALKDRGEWGHVYTALWTRGWFHNPRVGVAYGVVTDDPDERVERIKRVIYTEFGLQSLSELEPQYLVASCDQMGIKDTLPSGVIDAAKGRAI